MNAYELADELLRDNTQLTVKAAYMLRQQADRIAELESKLETIRSRKDLLNFILDRKPLSDEEIYELWCEADNTELLPEMRLKDGSINYIITTFAKLIEERHGIK